MKEKVDAEQDAGPVDPKVESFCVNAFVSYLLESAVPHTDLLVKITALPGTKSKKQPMVAEDRLAIYSITRAAWSIVPEYHGVAGQRRLDSVICDAIKTKLNNVRLKKKVVQKKKRMCPCSLKSSR